jgi:hypothetical protein
MASHLDTIGEEIAKDAADIDAALHRVLTKIRVFDQGLGWASQGFRSCAGWLSWRVNWTDGTAREHVRVANALGGLPAIDRALERGELSYCKVRAMTRVATSANEQVLLEQARHMTGADLEALCRKYASVRDHDDPKNSNPQDDRERRYVTRHDRDDGMVVIKAVLHPDEAAKVWTALERVAADSCRARNAKPRSEANLESCGNVSAETLGADQASVSEDRYAADEVNVSAEMSAADEANVPAEAFRASRGGRPEGALHGSCTSCPPNRHASTIGASNAMCASVSAETSINSNTHAFASSVAKPSGNISAGTNLMSASGRKLVAFDRADALVELAEQLLRGTSPARSPTELVISVPIEALQNPSVARADPTRIGATADGTGLSMHAIRRLACDCGVVPLIEDGNGNPSQVGRKFRVIAGALKRALFNRDKTCRFPGCKARAFLEGHHMVHWLNGGPTTLSNMVALCGFHHRFVHEYGFTIELEPTTNTVTAYDTANHRSISTLPKAIDPARADLGWPSIHARNDRYGITADTQTCWDTTPVDYPELVDHLVRADDRARATAKA